MTGEIASVSVSGVRAKAYGRKPITAGTIGATVTFTYDESWEGMMKTLVWKGSGRIVDDTTASGTVPAEVVTEAGTSLFVGVYGTKDGVATPTVWADLGVILEGVDPSGDESTDPSLPVWAQLIDRIGDVDAALDGILEIQNTFIGGEPA